MTRLTLPRLRAIAEALGSRLAGEPDVPFGSSEDMPERKHFEAAENWVYEEIRKREDKKTP